MVAVKRFGQEEWDLMLVTGGQPLTDALAKFYGEENEFQMVGFGLAALYSPQGELLGFVNTVGNPKFSMEVTTCEVTMYCREVMPAMRM